MCDQPGELPVRDRRRVVIAQVGQDGPNSCAGASSCPGVASRRVIPAVPMTVPDVVDQGDLVGDIPHGPSVGLDDQLDAIDDPLARQHMLVIDAELIGQEGRREVIVGLADDVAQVRRCPVVPAVEGIVDEEGPIDPVIAAVAILDPGQDVVQAVEERGQLETVSRQSHVDAEYCPWNSRSPWPWSIGPRFRLAPAVVTPRPNRARRRRRAPCRPRPVPGRRSGRRGGRPGRRTRGGSRPARPRRSGPVRTR